MLKLKELFSSEPQIIPPGKLEMMAKIFDNAETRPVFRSLQTFYDNENLRIDRMQELEWRGCGNGGDIVLAGTVEAADMIYYLDVRIFNRYFQRVK